MKLLDILNNEYFEDKEILKTLNKHSKEIEDEKTRYKTMQNMGKGRISDIDKIPFLYSTGSAADAALADDIIDLEYGRLQAKKRKREKETGKGHAAGTLDGAREINTADIKNTTPRSESAKRVEKLVQSYLKARH